MAELSINTLMVAVRAVHAEAQYLADQIAEADEDVDVSDLEEQLLPISIAEAELKKAYLAHQLTSENLPEYNDLVS